MKLRNLIKRAPQYFLFAGKGGVGKTTLAAATALHFSAKGKKVLIISTDPAHSLSDSFEIQIGGNIKKLRENLFAVEIDPQKAMQEYKEKITPKIEKIEYLKDFDLSGAFDMAGMTPGIDEIAAFDKFLQYMQSKEYDVIIFDTAPTGHTLRFLSLPDLLDSWVGKMIKIRMQFAGFINMIRKLLPFAKGDEKQDIGIKQLEGMKKRILEAKKILANSKKTHYNLVLTPEEMSILESERSIKVLNQYNIPVHTIIVNQIIPNNPNCKFCSARREQQLERLKTIKEKFKKFKILELPLFKEEIKGFKILEKVWKELCK